MRLARLLAALMAVAFLLPAAAQAAPAYYPSGPQTNVARSVPLGGGWEVCYQGRYNAGGQSISGLLDACPGPYLMMAGGPVGGAYTVLAAAPREDVIFDVPGGSAAHEANGTGWYFAGSYSWGFAKAGDPVARSSCDTSAVNGALRLCWHTSGGSLAAGWRAGTATGLNGSAAYERVVLRPSRIRAVAAPDPADFGSQTMPATSAARTVTYTVTGAANLTSEERQLGALQVVGANAGDFSVVSEDCPDEAPDNASTTCTAQLRFSPEAKGARTAKLQFANAASDAITLTGVGVLVVMTADPSSHDFGDTPVDGQGEHRFTITNTSDIAATVQLAGDGPIGLDANGEDRCSGQELAAGASCTVLVAFQPDSQGDTSLGVRTGRLAVSSTESPDPAEATQVTLTATAVPAAPRAADAVNHAQFNQAQPTIAIQGARPDATSVVLYVDGVQAGSTSTVDADGTAAIVPDAPLAGGDHTLTFSQTAQGYSSLTGNDTPVTVRAGAPSVERPTQGQIVTERTPLLTVAGALSRLPVNVYLDGTLIASQDSEHDGYASLRPTDPLADGPHTLQVSTTDSTGHEGARSAPTAFVVDATAPDAPTVIDPPDGSTTTDTTPDIHVTAEPGSRVHLLVDADDDQGIAIADADGKVTFTLSQPLSESQHELTVSARDAGNNAGAERSSTFTVDASAPAAPAVTGGPQGAVTSTAAQFEFSGEAGARFECSLDGGAFAPCTSPQAYTSLSVGQHTFEVRQTDFAGRTGPAATQSFTVVEADTIVPAPDATTLKLAVATTGTISHSRVPVGCRVDAGKLASCTVRAYAGGGQVGAGTVRFTGGRLGTVPVRLTARGLALVHRLGGVRLTYRAAAVTAAGRTLRATTASRVLPLTVAAIPSDGLFASGEARLNAYGKRFVRSLAGQMDGAKRVRCTGHTDSVGTAAYNQRLGLARAEAVCAQPRSAGVTAGRTVRSSGERDPRASNATRAGRALNRRVELVVSYR